MSRTPLPAQPILTAALPTRCPACAALDITKLDAAGIWRVACRVCGWSEKYRIAS